MKKILAGLFFLILTSCVPQTFDTLSSLGSENAESSKMLFGVNGHDKRVYYPLSQSEEVFKLLNSKNLRTYRLDVGTGDTAVLDLLVPLAAKYKIKLRPMLYPATQANAYAFAKRYGSAIEVWEIGNEQDYSISGAQTRIDAMYQTYLGIKQAASELGINLKTSVNVMSCNSDDMTASARCPGDRNGAKWFLDMAWATGIKFDYFTFHYYPNFGDKGYWMDMYLGQMRAIAEAYKVKVFYNEVHCAEIYRGTTDSGAPGDTGCYESVNILFHELTTKYADIVAEVNMYELFDEPNVGGVESHFGVMYDINTPKQIFDLLVAWANK